MATRIKSVSSMADRDRDEQGRYQEEYVDEDFLDAVREHEPATTTEIAEAVGCVRQNADYRLRQLKEDGRVTSKKVGPSVVWLIPEDSDC